jgi:MFS family permease
MSEYKLDNTGRLRDGTGREIGTVDSSNIVWDGNRRTGYIDGSGNYVDERGHPMGWVTALAGSSMASASVVFGELLLAAVFAIVYVVGTIVSAVISIVVPIVAPIFFLAIASVPLAAPILLVASEQERKRGNLKLASRWKAFWIVASVLSILVVAGTAIMMVFSFVGSTALWFYYVTGPSSTSILLGVLVAGAVGLVALLPLFVTGMSPTTITYLHLKEAQLRTIGKIANANRLRQVKRLVGIVATVTIGLAILAAIIFSILGLQILINRV